VAILVCLRNWVNPLFEEEISRTVRALEQHTLTVQLEGRYNRIYKCIIAPAFPFGQAKMERFRGVRLYEARYIVLNDFRTPQEAHGT
jgi:hypothetical protein